MDLGAVVLAVVIGAVQGLLEWLPVSSEGGVALVVTVVGGERPDLATQLALMLHAGTAVAAVAFYREDVTTLAGDLPDWRPHGAFEGRDADLTFLGVATLVSGLVGIGVYAALSELVSALQGGAFVSLVGGLLVITGVIQRAAEGSDAEVSDATGGRDAPEENGATGAGGPASGRDRPDALDAVLVGVLQGFALLPGVSRSGTTVSALLLRGHAGEASLRLSFLLSIPASLGAGLLVVVDEGVPVVAPWTALLALATSAVVGYLTVRALVGLVRRIAFWGVCVGFGSLAIVGGVVLLA